MTRQDGGDFTLQLSIINAPGVAGVVRVDCPAVGGAAPRRRCCGIDDRRVLGKVVSDVVTTRVGVLSRDGEHVGRLPAVGGDVAQVSVDHTLVILPRTEVFSLGAGVTDVTGGVGVS